jgi:hypothetical protein
MGGEDVQRTPDFDHLLPVTSSWWGGSLRVAMSSGGCRGLLSIALGQHIWSSRLTSQLGTWSSGPRQSGDPSVPASRVPLCGAWIVYVSSRPSLLSCR